jgi:hypothetical protein
MNEFAMGRWGSFETTASYYYAVLTKMVKPLFMNLENEHRHESSYITDIAPFPDSFFTRKPKESEVEEEVVKRKANDKDHGR